MDYIDEALAAIGMSHLRREYPNSLWVLKEDDPRFGLKAGDILECQPYWLDPTEKLTVIKRVADGFDPECNVYRSMVTRSAARGSGDDAAR